MLLSSTPSGDRLRQFDRTRHRAGRAMIARPHTRPQLSGRRRLLPSPATRPQLYRRKWAGRPSQRCQMQKSRPRPVRRVFTMCSDRHSKPLRLFLCCVGMGAVTWLAAARTDAFTDPATAMAMAEAASQAAKKAQEVSKTAKEILEFLEGNDSDPAASLESISQRLTALQNSVNDMKGQVSEMRRFLEGIDDKLVQHDNILRLLQVEDATSHIYKASGALQRLQFDPKDLNLDLEADSESFTALLKLQGNAVDVF